MIPITVSTNDFEVNHLHINARPILEDINVMLPVNRMVELAEEGVVGDLAPTTYPLNGPKTPERPIGSRRKSARVSNRI